MSKFRKKPVVIEAVQFSSGMTFDEMEALGVESRIISKADEPYETALVVSTLEGLMRVSDGDWIITGVKGEKYPCKDEIFQATYDPCGDRL